MSKLTKSLSELDAMADELLAKSQKSKKVDDEIVEETKYSKASEDDKEELSPEDVSENVPEEEVKNTEETTEKDEETTEDDEEEVEETVEKSLTEDEGEYEEELEELEKSIHSTFEDNDEIRKSIDASEFLSAVTEVLSKALADVVYNMKGSSQQSVESNDVLAKSLQASLNMNRGMSEELALVKSQNASLRKSIEDGFADIRGYIEDQFEQFSHQPSTMRKSIGNVNVHERNFQKSLTGGYSGSEHLSKAEVLSKLNAYMYSGNPLVQPSDIISYESGAPLRPEVAQLIQTNM